MTKGRFLFATGLLAAVVVLQGCQSAMLICDRGDVRVPADVGSSSARYCLASVKGMQLTERHIKWYTSAGDLFALSEDAMPIDVVVSCVSVCRTYEMYNALAFLSLSVLPFCADEKRTYNVKVSAFGVEETRTFSLLCRELGTYLPNPMACLPTSFVCERFKLSCKSVDRVPSCVSFDSHGSDVEMKLAAEAVVSTLGKLPYDAWRQQMRQQKLRQREIAECDAAENGWRNEDTLREFAVREAPALWNTVQTLRGEIAHRRKLLATLRASLEEFGKDPAGDAGFQALVEKCEALRAPLARIFTKLEDAYIAYRKFEASPSRDANRRLMRQALEDGIKEAEMVSKRHLDMRKRKQNGK